MMRFMAACRLAQPGARSIKWDAMIQFSLFGVRVSIHPTLWLTLAFLGGAFMISSVVELFSVLLFILAAFVVLLAHEMGHALVGRKLGGGQPYVYLAWLGGDCMNEAARLTRRQGVVMTACGPLFSALVGASAFVLMGAYVGDFGRAAAYAAQFVQGYMPAEAVMSYPPLAMFLFFFLIEVSCWWTLLNLLPVFPLDGGQIMQGLMKSPRQVHGISLVAALAVAGFAVVVHLWLLCIFMVLLAVLNHKLRQETHSGGTDFH